MTKGDTKKKSDVSRKSTEKKKSTSIKKSNVSKKSSSKTTAPIKSTVITKTIESNPTTVKTVSTKATTPTKSIPVKKLIPTKPIVKDSNICCPEFDPKPWDKKEIKWRGKYFVKDTVITPFHIPLNFGAVMKRNCKKIDAAKLGTKNPIVVMDIMSPFHSHVYISVTKPVVGCHDVKLTGNFLSMVFEGPYKNTNKFIKEMSQYAKLKGKKIKKNYFFYPTCPKCSKKYGKNYTVILAEY